MVRPEGQRGEPARHDDAEHLHLEFLLLAQRRMIAPTFLPSQSTATNSAKAKSALITEFRLPA